MKLLKLLALLLSLSLLLVAIGCGDDENAVTEGEWTGQTYKLAIFLLLDRETAEVEWQPIADYLSEKTGATFKLVFYDTAETYLNAFKNSEIAFGIQFPTVTAKLLESSTLIAKLRSATKFGWATDKQRGIFISHRDTIDELATVATIAQIPGHTLACPPGASAGNSLLSIRVCLKEEGIDISEIECFEYESLQAVLQAVMSGEADVGAVPELAWEELTEDMENAELLADIGKGVWVPGSGVVANNDLPEELVAMVQSALLELHEDDEVFEGNSALVAFVPAETSEYESLTNCVPLANITMK